MSTPLDRAISESRERESKATSAPWHVEQTQLKGNTVWGPLPSNPSAGTFLVASTGFAATYDFDNVCFIAASRTYEPIFRDALSVAVGALNSWNCHIHGPDETPAKPCTACAALTQITRLVEGAGKGKTT